MHALLFWITVVCGIQIKPLFDTDSLKKHFWLLCNGKLCFNWIIMRKPTYYEEAEASNPFTIFQNYHLLQVLPSCFKQTLSCHSTWQYRGGLSNWYIIYTNFYPILCLRFSFCYFLTKNIYTHPHTCKYYIKINLRLQKIINKIVVTFFTQNQQEGNNRYLMDINRGKTWHHLFFQRLNLEHLTQILHITYHLLTDTLMLFAM